VPEVDDVKLVVFPRKKSLLETIMQRGMADNSDKESAAVGLSAMRDMIRVVQPVARQMHALGVDHEGMGDDVLRMPQLEVGN